MTTSRTPNLGLALPDFNQAPWHDLVNGNMQMLDAIIYSALGISNFRGVFVNSTQVLLGERYFDPASGQLYQALTTYVTSPAPTTFAEELLLFPTYWASVNEVVLTALEDAQTAALVAEMWAAKMDGPVTPEPNAKFSARWYSESALGAAEQAAADRALTTAARDTTQGLATTVATNKLAVDAAVASIADAKITWRGPWATATAYVTRDAVSRNGTSYIAKSNHTSAALTDPGSGANWATVWDVLALKGEQGDVGPAGPGSGDVLGPASAVNDRIAVFNGTTGKLLKDGGLPISGLATAAQGAKADTALQPGASIPWTNVTGKPTTFTPSSHTHPVSQLSDATTAGRSLLTAADVAAQRTLLESETTTQLNARDGANRNRLNHTGTQPASTITGLAPVATSGSAADLNAGVLPAARFNDTAHGARGGGGLHALATTIVAGFMSTIDKAKLDNIEPNATANDTNANLRNRANHTGTQPASTISDFDAAVAANPAVAANTAKQTNATHTGDVTGSDALTIANDAVSNAKLANMAANTIKGRSATTGDPQDLTAAQARSILGVAEGATANQTDAFLLARANHTGTQPASTISDFNTAVAAAPAVVANTAKQTNATHTGDVTGSGALTIANNAVTNAKLADVPTATLKGRNSAGTGDPQDLTVGQVLALLNVAAGATANSSDAFLLSRANHTGTQLASTISDFAAAVAAVPEVQVPKVYAQNDADLDSVVIPATQQLLFRMPTEVGQVAPANQLSIWRVNTTPGSETSCTTNGGTVFWTPAQMTRTEMLAILYSVLEGAFTDAIFLGRTNFADGTVGAPAMRFTADADTGLFRPANDQLGFATNGVLRALLSNTAMTINVPVTGSAVTSNVTDTTAGKLLRVGDYGLGNAIQLGSTDNLNDLTASGFYYNPTASNTPGNNYPISSAGSLLNIRRSATNWTQRYSTYAGSSLRTDIRIFERSYGSAGWTPWVEIFHQGSILGTVSQSGGIPTGRVIQRGSNANGEFVRFADGSQFCAAYLEAVTVETAKGALFGIDATRTWTFPIAFIAPPVVNPGSGGGVNRWLTAGPPSATAVGWEVLSHTSSNVASGPSISAFGRWF